MEEWDDNLHGLLEDLKSSFLKAISEGLFALANIIEDVLEKCWWIALGQAEE